MEASSMLLGFMITWAKWLPTVIVLIAAFILLKKLRVPRWQLWAYVGAVVLGMILSQFAAAAQLQFLKTYGDGGTLYIASFLSLLSANIGPVALLVLAMKARSNAIEATGKEWVK
jgi:hypothetical protein